MVSCIDFPLNQSIDCCFVHKWNLGKKCSTSAFPRTAIWTPIGLNPWTASWTTVACWPCLPMKEFLWSFTWRWSLKLGTEIVGHKSGVITCDNRMDSPSNSGTYQLVDSSLVDFLGLNIPRYIYIPPYNEVLATLAMHLPSIPTSEKIQRELGPGDSWSQLCDTCHCHPSWHCVSWQGRQGWIASNRHAVLL